jgi:hypothetical protein
MNKKFHFSFGELNIIPKDLTDLLGFENGIIPEPFPEIIEQALLEAPKYCNIKGGYKIFDSVEINHKDASIKIVDKIFLPSKIITTQLKESTSVALYICTAGEDISNHANKLLSEGDPMLSYIFDVIGSVTVEKATDKIQELLEIECNKSGLSISDRYSPGYCEWSVAEQQILFSFFPNNFCGISLSKSSLMSPIKSVSGIIGIGAGLQQKGYQCHWCNDKNCIYGKIKRQGNSSKTN